MKSEKKTKEMVLKEMELAEQKTKLLKAKVKAEVQVFITAMDLNDPHETEESFKRIGELLGMHVYKGEHSTWGSLLGLMKHINNLRLALIEIERGEGS